MTLNHMTHSSFTVTPLKTGQFSLSHSSLLDSGHGGQTPDMDGDEVDGYDEGPLNSA